jgi:ribosome biogenesis GTPase / thiamine phosphate phosphatase
MNRATVTATFSRRMRVLLPDGTEADARIKGKRLKPVCGDLVTIKPLADEDEWLITGIEERRNELTRPNTSGRVEVLAANLDYLCVVAAAAPKPDWFIVDRYLCAAELMAIGAAVVFNKADLDGGAEVSELDVYRNIGYDVISCSAVTGAGIDDLAIQLQGHRSIIVGQSGVGKSTIINRLIDAELQPTAAISDKTREGRHTTVNSAMIPLPAGGAIIDSPGVRDYAPALETAAIAAQGFREIRDAAQGCRFANCWHLREPGCAVRDQVDAGTISARRYESYKRIVNITRKLAEGRY